MNYMKVEDCLKYNGDQGLLTENENIIKVVGEKRSEHFRN